MFSWLTHRSIVSTASQGCAGNGNGNGCSPAKASFTRSARKSSSAGYDRTGVPPCPWFWHDTVCRLAVGILARDGCLHVIVKHFACSTAAGCKSDRVTAQHRPRFRFARNRPRCWRLLPGTNQNSTTLHHAPGLVRELHREPGKICLNPVPQGSSQTLMKHARQLIRARRVAPGISTEP